MAATLTKNCPSCGSAHLLCYASGDMVGGLNPSGKMRRFAYTCPKTQQAVKLPSSDSDWWTDEARGRPRGSIKIRGIEAGA